jgi:glycosyltransferase involved in cell wall biosynthesis
MDASLFLIKPSFSKLASSPTKLGELMAMGIPVICNDKVGDVKEIVEKYKAGIVLSSLTISEFESACDLMEKGDYFNREIMKKGAKDYYDLELGVEKYDQIYKTLL